MFPLNEETAIRKREKPYNDCCRAFLVVDKRSLSFPQYSYLILRRAKVVDKNIKFSMPFVYQLIAFRCFGRLYHVAFQHVIVGV